MIKKAIKSKTTQPSGTKKSSTGIDLKRELIEEFVERGKKQRVLSYEEVVEFGDKNHLSEGETNSLLKLLEKENVELAMQEELDTDHSKPYEAEEGVHAPKQNLTSKLSTI